MSLFDDLFDDEPEFDPDDTPVSPINPVVVVAMIRPRRHPKGLAVMPEVIKGSMLYERLLADGYLAFERLEE